MFNITKFESGTIFIQDNSAHASRIQVYEGELPAFIQKLSQYLPQEPRTTNLNFWEAYQAMKRGEWVATKLNPMIDRYFIGEDDQIWSTEKRGTEHASFSSYEYNNTEWYIVPKGPRYKVGDRFCCTNIDKEWIIEIVYADDEMGKYATKRTVNGKGDGLHIYTEDDLNNIRKLPS